MKVRELISILTKFNVDEEVNFKLEGVNLRVDASSDNTIILKQKLKDYVVIAATNGYGPIFYCKISHDNLKQCLKVPREERFKALLKLQEPYLASLDDDYDYFVSDEDKETWQDLEDKQKELEN